MAYTGPLGKLRAAATAGEMRFALSRLEALVAAGDYDALKITKQDVVETCEQWRNAHDKKHWNRTVAVVLGQCLRALGKAGGGGGGGGGGGERGAATAGGDVPPLPIDTAALNNGGAIWSRGRIPHRDNGGVAFRDRPFLHQIGLVLFTLLCWPLIALYLTPTILRASWPTVIRPTLIAGARVGAAVWVRSRPTLVVLGSLLGRHVLVPLASSLQRCSATLLAQAPRLGRALLRTVGFGARCILALARVPVDCVAAVLKFAVRRILSPGPVGRSIRAAASVLCDRVIQMVRFTVQCIRSPGPVGRAIRAGATLVREGVVQWLRGLAWLWLQVIHAVRMCRRVFAAVVAAVFGSVRIAAGCIITAALTSARGLGKAWAAVVVATAPVVVAAAPAWTAAKCGAVAIVVPVSHVVARACVAGSRASLQVVEAAGQGLSQGATAVSGLLSHVVSFMPGGKA